MQEELNQITQSALLEKMQFLPVQLPSQFVRLAEYEGEQRYLGLWYSATQSCLADGRMMRGISFYRAYSPLVDHPAISLYVRRANADLGSDDTEPTHCLLLDIRENKIFLGKFNTVQTLLETQYPQTEPELKAELEKTADLMRKFENPKTLQDFHKLGMFEFFGASRGDADEETNRLLAEMNNFLNQFVPPEIADLVRKYGSFF